MSKLSEIIELAKERSYEYLTTITTDRIRLVFESKEDRNLILHVESCVNNYEIFYIQSAGVIIGTRPIHDFTDEKRFKELEQEIIKYKRILKDHVDTL